VSFDGASRYLSTARLLLPEVEIFLASRLVSFQRTCIIPAELQAVSSLNDSALCHLTGRECTSVPMMKFGPSAQILAAH